MEATLLSFHIIIGLVGKRGNARAVAVFQGCLCFLQVSVESRKPATVAGHDTGYKGEGLNGDNSSGLSDRGVLFKWIHLTVAEVLG